MDTGPLVAAANPSDPDHETCAALLRSAEPPLVVPNPVVAEACYLIGKHLGARAEATFSGPSPEGAIGRNRRRTPTCSAPPISLSSTSTFVSEGPTPSSSQPPNVSGSRCSPPSTNGTSALYGRPMWPPSRQSPEPAVVLTGVAPAAKAALGPTAWAVLGGTDPRRRNCEDGRLAVTTSVRRLGNRARPGQGHRGPGVEPTQLRRLRAPVFNRPARRRLALRDHLALWPDSCRRRFRLRSCPHESGCASLERGQARESRGWGRHASAVPPGPRR